jgi:hypothetical protein
MIEQRDVQVCSRGCCIYVNSQRLTKEGGVQQIDPKDALVYDAKSHRYLRIATAEDARKWLGAEVKAVITLQVNPVCRSYFEEGGRNDGTPHLLSDIRSQKRCFGHK